MLSRISYQLKLLQDAAFAVAHQRYGECAGIPVDGYSDFWHPPLLLLNSYFLIAVSMSKVKT